MAALTSMDISRLALIEGQKIAAWSALSKIQDRAGQISRELGDLRRAFAQQQQMQPYDIGAADQKKAQLDRMQRQIDEKADELRETRAAQEEATERFQAASQLFDNCDAHARGARA